MRSRRISCFHACFFGVFANPSNFFYVANVFLAFFFSVKVQYLNAVMYFYICTNSLRPWEGAAGGGGGWPEPDPGESTCAWKTDRHYSVALLTVSGLRGWYSLKVHSVIMVLEMHGHLHCTILCSVDISLKLLASLWHLRFHPSSSF